ncbi:MAG: hypothetical protein WA220_08185 [Candidatus Nitrosopolaris sp.]
MPLIIKSNASAALSSGKTSFIDRTPEDTLKESVSSESIEDPASQPTTDLCPKRKKFGDTSSGSSDAPIMIHFPLTARPPNTVLKAFPPGPVPRMILASPSSLWY